MLHWNDKTTILSFNVINLQSLNWHTNSATSPKILLSKVIYLSRLFLQLKFHTILDDKPIWALMDLWSSCVLQCNVPFVNIHTQFYLASKCGIGLNLHTSFPLKFFSSQHLLCQHQPDFQGMETVTISLLSTTVVLPGCIIKIWTKMIELRLFLNECFLSKQCFNLVGILSQSLIPFPTCKPCPLIDPFVLLLLGTHKFFL